MCCRFEWIILRAPSYRLGGQEAAGHDRKIQGQPKWQIMTTNAHAVIVQSDARTNATIVCTDQ
jgi:hypothetical protein